MQCFSKSTKIETGGGGCSSCHMAASYARGVLVSKSPTLPKGARDGFLPVNKQKKENDFLTLKKTLKH